MTPEQALKILDSICAEVSMNRIGHFRAQEALRILTNVVNDMKQLRESKKGEVKEFPKAESAKENK